MFSPRVIVSLSLLSIVLGCAGAALWLGTVTTRACPSLAAPGGEEAATLGFFSPDYPSARSRFLGAAAAAQGRVVSIRHPDPGPGGERLYLDVAWFGPPDAADVVVVSSGTHGVEGFAGSAIQLGLLSGGVAERLPPGVAMMMIHAINPYGMAHLRRFTEDNVDLNRNFRDHARQAPDNRPYTELAEVLAPVSLALPDEILAWGRLLAARTVCGTRYLQQAVSAGQYTAPEGLFYGGNDAAWSNRTLLAILPDHLARAERILFMDVHTGLGELGELDVLMNSPRESPEYERCETIWGADSCRTSVPEDPCASRDSNARACSVENGAEQGRVSSCRTDYASSPSVDLPGSLKLAVQRAFPEQEVTAVSFEFGTLSLSKVLVALRAENWAHHHAASGSDARRRMKRCLLRAFRPFDAEWEMAVWGKGRAFVLAAVKYLTGAELADSARRRDVSESH
ncbi:MAG: DUF2817 domain-containing protein [Gammaproteobacteria bacterium]